MSSIPHARRSTIKDITVIPEKWESYPTIERSVVNSSTFQNLNSSTSIRRSKLSSVTLQSLSQSVTTAGGRHCYIKRCDLSNSIVTDCSFKYFKCASSVLIQIGYAKWTKVQASYLDRVAYAKRLAAEESTLRNIGSIDASTIKRSSVSECSTIKRSTILRSKCVNIVVASSTLTDCEVSNAQLYRTTFNGMIVQNGIWENGQLIGRMDESKEVVVRSLKKDQEVNGPVSSPSNTCVTADGSRQGYAPQPSLKDKSREELASFLVTANGTNAGPASASPQQKHYPVDEKKVPVPLVDLDSESVSSHSDLESDGEEDFDAGDDSHDVPPPPYKA
jgi:hypothetical protein